MRKSAYNEPKRVLVFNGARRMIAIARSLHAAAELAGVSTMTVSYCCTGKSYASNGYYFRQEHPDIEILLDDLGTLKLEEYDELCGIKRMYHTKEYMNSMKMKSKKTKNTSQNNYPGKNNKKTGFFKKNIITQKRKGT